MVLEAVVRIRRRGVYGFRALAFGEPRNDTCGTGETYTNWLRPGIEPTIGPITPSPAFSRP
jgi:hypothetical protein